MDNKLPQYTVYAIFNKNGDYMGAVSTEALKDKVISKHKDLKGFAKIEVNKEIDKWLK